MADEYKDSISQASSSASSRVSSVQARAAAKQAELLVRQQAQKRRQELEEQELLLRQKQKEFVLQLEIDANSAGIRAVEHLEEEYWQQHAYSWWIFAATKWVASTTSWRGQPEELLSDNGTNFIGANAELKKALADLNQQDISHFCVNHGTKWSFNPPAASHFGGIWERQIRTIRKIFNAMLNELHVKGS